MDDSHHFFSGKGKWAFHCDKLYPFAIPIKMMEIYPSSSSENDPLDVNDGQWREGEKSECDQ